MQNLSDDERRDIDDLLSDLKPEEVAEEQENAIDDANSSYGESQPLVEPVAAVREEAEENNSDSDVSVKDLLNLVSLQNERLGVLNKKVDVLTRLVELILRANLEDVE